MNTLLTFIAAGIAGLLILTITLIVEIHRLRRTLQMVETPGFNQLCAANRRLMGILMVLRDPARVDEVIEGLGFSMNRLTPGSLREAAESQPDFNGLIKR